jgi:hypothetical protein
MHHKKATKKPSTLSKPVMMAMKSRNSKKTTFLDLVEDDDDITGMFRGLLIKLANQGEKLLP